MKLSTKLLLTAAAASAVIAGNLSAQTTWTGGAVDNDRFSATNNWDNGVPEPGNPGTVTDARVEIGTLGEMVTGATVTIGGASLLERNSIAASSFTGVLNINDTTNVNISYWSLPNGATLNWNSTGTFGPAPAGPSGQTRFMIDRDAPDTVVNMYAGFWDLTGNSATDSIQVDNGTFNMYGGLIIADNRFKVGRGDRSGTVNYFADAEIRAASMGTFFNSVFNFEPNATLYLESGLLGMFGTEGFEWLRDELRKGVDSSIYIGGVHQSLAVTEGLESSNFLTDTVQLDGIWYNSMTAVPEPGAYALIFGCIALAGILLHRRRRS
jgi:hypothetical protein